MPDTTPDAHVHLALHPQHPSAVVATLTGNTLHTARATLASEGFRPVNDDTMLLVRIDHEEPYYANITANLLRDAGIPVDITDQLQEEIDTEWTWASHPMTWLDRDGIRLVSAEAQKIHDDIDSGLLTIHLHAHDGHTTVAVGTYQHADSVHLHGEDHLRVVSGSYDTPKEAIADFERLYGDAVRPGPPPPTDTERQAAQALAGMSMPQTASAADASADPPAAKTELVPVYAADPGDHEALLDKFLEKHGEWDKYRTWEDSTTVANHESLTLRAVFDHDAEGREAKWTFAAYETPVSDRLWHGTATASTPTAIVSALLDAVANENAWGRSLSTSATEAAITEATSPLTDADWKHTIDGRYITWEAPGAQEGGVQFDAFAAQKADSPLPAWTIWGGHAVHQPVWALQLSANAPAALVQYITFEMAEGQGTRCVRPAAPDGPALRTAQAPALVAASPPAAHFAGRSR
ncbi:MULTISPECIES: DUF317 domain-containing protein [unclassified Streptomyces]|uniref:DUF317 domain-containing protein n=1 Tax=unclassified Streptomyces TaxID=2593676 RepID=UPI0008239305|nr:MULTISPECIES: DUF317 domain-containing protein [unclassified Streptomyces]MYT96641.1 DUF317 domain-containing protein [Streptomyces sp. SID8350]SCK54403.1 protein of unknown function [Streptomyces sp. AmelKG-D3]